MKRLAVAMAVMWLGAAVSDASSTQPTNCRNYVTCFEATGGTKGGLDSTFGAMGTCWTTNQKAADTCEFTCMNALTELSAMHPDAGCKAAFAPRATGCGG